MAERGARHGCRPAPVRRGRWSALVAVPLALLAACAAPDETTAPRGVSVSIVQARSDIASGQVALKVRNDGDGTVRVTSVSYHDPRFAAVPEWTRQTDIPAGAARDLRVQVPAPNCEAGAASAEGTAHVQFSTPEGAATADYGVDDPFDFVATHTAAECFAVQLSETGSVELAGVTSYSTGDGEVAVLVLTVAADADDPIRLDSVAGTVLLTPASGEPAWHPGVTVEPGESDTVELHAVPNRCDAHALAEDKVGTRLRATVTIRTDPPVTGGLTLAATDSQRGELHDFVSRHCGLRP